MIAEIFLAIFLSSSVALGGVAIYAKTRKEKNPRAPRDHPLLREKFPQLPSKNNSPKSITEVLVSKIERGEVDFEIASGRGKAAVEIEGIKFKSITSKKIEKTEAEIEKDFRLPVIPDEAQIPIATAPEMPTKVPATPTKVETEKEETQDRTE